jgi:hypothetical protein
MSRKTIKTQKMKKLLLLSASIILVHNLQAQQNSVPMNQANKVPVQKAYFDAAKFSSNKGGNAAKGMVDEHWLSYSLSVDQYNGVGISVLGSNYLFPDSLCYGEFGAGNFAPCWVHHLGDVLDVKSDIFSVVDGLTWDATTTFSVDSLSILYAYTRNESVTDTLVVTLCTNNVAANMGGYYFVGATAANYGTDTLCFRGLKYNFNTNLMNASGKLTFKIPLNDDDTAITVFREKKFAVPSSFIVPAGKLVGVDVMFLPGYSYNLGDSIDYQHNTFFFTSNEEFGAGTYQTYHDCNLLAADCDYNVSSIIPTVVRYNQDPNWNGLFIPSYAYTVDYAFEHHLISYKVTSPPLGTGVAETAGSYFTLAQNNPNPFTDKTTIRYQLAKKASQVTIEVYDTKGVKLFEQNETDVYPGKYTLDISRNNLAAGVYFCTLTVDGEKITNKIVAQ